MELVGAFHDLVFCLITKYAPHYWEEPFFQKKWDFEVLHGDFSEELSLGGFDSIDTRAISSNLVSALRIYLIQFHKDVGSPGETPNPRFVGLREEEARFVANGLVTEILKNDYMSRIYNVYWTNILSLREKLSQEIGQKRYPPSSRTISQQDLLGLPPSFR